MDSTDLEFFDDILLLEKQFDAMSEDSVISVGLDLSPHYRKFLAEYLAINPQVSTYWCSPSPERAGAGGAPPGLQHRGGALPAGQDEGEQPVQPVHLR